MDDSIQVLKSFQLERSTQTKLSDEYGERVAKYIQSTVFNRQSYYYLRNRRFETNEQWASGRIDVQRMFQDRLDMNGKTNFVNIAYESTHLVNTIISRLVGRWMLRSEKVSVTAIDTQSEAQKEASFRDAEFALDNKDMINGLQQASGVPVVNQNQFIPEDKDQLDIWKSEENRLPEEIGYEMGVKKVFDANGFFDVQKEKLLHDSASKGFVGTYTWMDGEGEIHVEWVKPENAIYSYSEYDDFRDTTWRGQVKSYKISYLREKYGKQNGGKLSEEDLFKIACTCKEYQASDKITWNAQYTWDMYRPYDEWNKDGFDFELRSVDSDVTSMTVSKAGTLTVRTNSGQIPADAKTFKKDKYNIYKGVYLFGEGSNILLEWGLKKNMIRPQDPKELGDAEFSYSFYMYQNVKMRNLAVPEKIEDPVKQMILLCLKVQQLVAAAVPAGWAINQDALDAVELGIAGGTNPASVMKNHQQTGKLYYRGKDAEGNLVGKPVEEMRNDGFVSQMTAFEAQYAFQYQRVKDELGEDPNLMQQASQPRVAVDNIQTSLNQADAATGFMYMAYVRVMEETAKKVSCLLNDSVTFGAKAYRSLLKEEQVKGRNFSAKINLLPGEADIARLDAMMNNAIATNPKLILYIDPFKIMRVAKEDIKLAELYFRRGQKKCLSTEADLQSKNIQDQANAASQAAQMKGEQDKEIAATSAQATERLAVLNGAFTLLAGQVPIPPELSAVLQGVIQNIAIPLSLENKQIMAAMQQQSQPQQQPDQSQQMPQQQAAA